MSFYNIMTNDELEKTILNVIEKADQPLETKEIEWMVKANKGATRIKVIYRLNNLRGEGKIKGKFIGSGKGVWIWWKRDVFK